MKINNIIIILSLIFLSACTGGAINTNPTNADGTGINTQVIGSTGNKAEVSEYSEQYVCSRLDQLEVQFQYNIADFDVNTLTIDTGTIVQDTSQVLLSTGTGLNAETHIESIEAIRYRPGHEAYALYTAAFLNGGVAGVEQLTGAYNELEDGYFIGYNGTTNIVGRYYQGNTEQITRDNWHDKLDGTGKSTCVVDFTKLHQYRLRYGWLGIARVHFDVNCGSNIGWVNFYTMDKTNNISVPIIGNPVLPIQMHIKKNGVTDNVQIRSSSWGGGICNGGAIEAGIRRFAAHKTQTIPANTLTTLITLKANETKFGKTNRIDTVLSDMSVAVDGNKSVEIYIIKNPDLNLTGLQYVNINNSMMLVDYTQYSLLNNSGLEYVFGVSKTGSFRYDIKSMYIDLHKGETITIAALSSGISDIIPTVRWEELY